MVPATGASYNKAFFTNVDTGGVFYVQVNPKEFKLDEKANWKASDEHEEDKPLLTYEKGEPSVVTMAPLTQSISEPVDRVFLPGGEKDYAGPANAEVFVDLEGEDMPDHFEGNEADLSDLIIETLALSVDLYPREAGASLKDTGFEPDRDESSPFDVLKALKPEDN